MCRSKALREENIYIEEYFNNYLLSLSPRRIKNLPICSKGTAFSKISQMKFLFLANCECTTISTLIHLKNELQDTFSAVLGKAMNEFE